jgi:hypothetical protein
VPYRATPFSIPLIANVWIPRIWLSDGLGAAAADKPRQNKQEDPRVAFLGAFRFARLFSRSLSPVRGRGWSWRDIGNRESNADCIFSSGLER